MLPNISFKKVNDFPFFVNKQILIHKDISYCITNARGPTFYSGRTQQCRTLCPITPKLPQRTILSSSKKVLIQYISHQRDTHLTHDLKIKLKGSSEHKSVVKTNKIFNVLSDILGPSGCSVMQLVKDRGHSHNKRKLTNEKHAVGHPQPIKCSVTIHMQFLPIWRVSPPHIIIIR